MKFEVTEKQKKRIDKWKKKIYPQAIRKQQKEVYGPNSPLYGHALYLYEEAWDMGYPRGEIHYIFTPGSIGTSLVVKESVTGEELDVTDYDSW